MKVFPFICGYKNDKNYTFSFWHHMPHCQPFLFMAIDCTESRIARQSWKRWIGWVIVARIYHLHWKHLTQVSNSFMPCYCSNMGVSLKTHKTLDFLNKQYNGEVTSGPNWSCCIFGSSATVCVSACLPARVSRTCLVEEKFGGLKLTPIVGASMFLEHKYTSITTTCHYSKENQVSSIYKQTMYKRIAQCF